MKLKYTIYSKSSITIMISSYLSGVRETAKKLNDTQSKKLLDELDELCELIANLSNIAKSPDGVSFALEKICSF